MHFTVITAYKDGYCKSEGSDSYVSALNSVAIYAADPEWWHTYIFDNDGEMIAKIQAPQ